ncbi:MAG: hypothetical protein H6555_08750 [Lewinellaceae bacterium]|nr:hypothetical protein [Lewinellaceae bacterium]
MTPLTDHFLESLISRFLAGTLLHHEWTHEAHLCVGLWHVLQYPQDEALVHLRQRITYFNTRIGIENTTNSGYHETLTTFYVQLLAFYVQQVPGKFLQQANQLIASPLADRSLPLTFYSRELLFSATARAQWVAPDLKPLIFSAYIVPTPPSLTD